MIYVGTIPAALGGLHRLRRLDLSGNSLTGSIPARLTQLTSLQELLLQGNQLTGSLPEAIGQLAALTSLQLQHNHFQGMGIYGLYCCCHYNLMGFIAVATII